jgi:hypothetical protein
MEDKMDPVVLAPTVFKILLPFMPALLNKAGELAADKTAQFAKKVWEKISSKVLADPGAKDAAENVAADPGDETNQKLFELQLQRLLKKDADLQQSLIDLLKEQGPSSIQQSIEGGTGIQNTGNVDNSNFVIGDNNTFKK